MHYNIKAIPTTYSGVNFRSRLEARWAAFFDSCGWEWDYEPFDLEGWAPDFMLKGKTRALVEVKPIDFTGNDKTDILTARSVASKVFDHTKRFELKDWSGESLEEYERVERYNSKIQRCDYEVLVIGNGPFQSNVYSEWSLGVLALSDGGTDTADLFYGRSYHLDYAGRYGSYKYRMGGEHEGDHHLRYISGDEPQEMWRTAGNESQWIPNHRVAA